MTEQGELLKKNWTRTSLDYKFLMDRWLFALTGSILLFLIFIFDLDKVTNPVHQVLAG